MWRFARSTPRSYSNRPGERRRQWRERPREPLRDLLLVAAEHVREPRHVIEADERVGDHEPALWEVRPRVRQLDRRLEPRRVVVGEVADHRLAARLGLLEPDQARAVADEGVPAQPAALDGLEEERGPAFGAQPQVRPERGDEVCGDDGDRVHVGSDKQKDPPAGRSSSGTGFSA